MPTYDYECGNCGHVFDAFQAMSDDPLKKCPECGKNSLKRLIGGGLGVIFKGSGFYSTDSRSSSKSTISSDTSKKSSDDSKTSSTGDSSGSKSGKDSSSGKTEKVAG